VEVTDSGKHSSLLRLSKNYAVKSFEVQVSGICNKQLFMDVDYLALLL
jgi:hypothetical protein